MQRETSQGDKVLPAEQVQEYLHPPAGSVERGVEVRQAVLPLQPSQRRRREGAAAPCSFLCSIPAKRPAGPFVEWTSS